MNWNIKGTTHWTTKQALILLGILTLAACNGGGSESAPGAKSPKLLPSIRESGVRQSGIPDKGVLSKAVYFDDLEKVVALLKSGADANENLGTEGFQVTPLLIAVYRQNIEMIACLLKHDASSYVSFGGYSVRDLAFNGGNSKVVAALGDGVSK